MSFIIKNNNQLKPPNSGIKHLKSEEREHFQISSRPNTQYQTTLLQKNHKAHYTSTWNENGAKWMEEPLFWKYRLLPLMCLKYNTGSLQTQSMTQSTICMPRFSNSLPLKCNMYKTIKRSFMSCNVGLKVGEKRGTNVFAICGAKSQKDYGPTNNKPRKQQKH